MLLRVPVILLFLLGSISSGLWAQAGHFEDTWIEFLSDPKTSSVSELPEPPKEDEISYAKYCLMYANSHFCASDINNANKFIAEIKKLGEPIYSKISGFAARFADLQDKIELYHKMGNIWLDFSNSGSTAQFGADIEGARMVCEKGTLAKYYYVASRQAYCEGKISEARELFEKRVLYVEKSGFALSNVSDLPKEVALSKKLYAGLDKLDPAWKQLMSSDKSPGFDTELPLIACYPVPTIKAYILQAMVDPCKNGSAMLKKIDALRKDYTKDLGADVQGKIDWLRKEVGNSQEEIAMVNKTWKEFLPKEKLDKKVEFSFDYPCDRAAEIKAYLMVGFSERCSQGGEILEKIEARMKEHNPQLDAETKQKLEKFRGLVKNEEENIAALNKAWAEFLPQDTLTSGITFAYEYCDKIAQVRAHVMTGIIEYCTRGEEMLAGAEKTMKEASPSLDGATQQRFDKLKSMVEKNQADLAALNGLWKQYIANKDTLTEEFRVEDFYCDKMAQVKSWTMMGAMNTCEQGQGYMDKIDAFQKLHKLNYNKELQCAVNRLRQKIWDCRYWEIVRRAERETHEERERFGPEAAELMVADLNTQKMPCPTTVDYKPLGTIGVKYTITTFLCSNIDLAKMGDPEYYKKIATWVDTKVLTKYCLADMRCKEDFTIYIEGHSDGNPFPGANYKTSFGIPQGLKFMHYTEKDTVERTTEREITTRLSNNMELGLARAWTIKQQLDFMGVPIEVGAYEHPKTERGGEYRRMETNLNITNLLLDFYEKRLTDLLRESGIGDRPKECR